MSTRNQPEPADRPAAIALPAPPRGRRERRGGGAAKAVALATAQRRVALLAIAITVMGLADLVLTLTYMRTTGMYELNPLARTMVAIGGAQQLIIFKLLTLSLSAGVLFLLRRHRIVEPTAWACVLIMGVLTVHWVSYNNEIENPDVWHGMQLAMGDERFVLISER